MHGAGAKLRWKSRGSPGTDLVEQLAAASERFFNAKLTPGPSPAAAALCEAIARRDWMLKAKLPAHASGTPAFADRPAELAHCAARVRLRASSKEYQLILPD